MKELKLNIQQNNTFIRYVLWEWLSIIYIITFRLLQDYINIFVKHFFSYTSLRGVSQCKKINFNKREESS